MYCTQCGAPGAEAGNFCGACGTPLRKEAAPAAPCGDWSHEHRYDVLVRVSEVRDRISRHASRARTALSAEEFLQLGDKVLSPLMGGIPVGKLATIVQPLYARLGVKTGQQREERFPHPIGEVLTATLCALAAAGQTLRGVEQAEDGCRLDAILPSDLFSFAGDVRIRLTRQEGGTSLVAATNVPGQWYDWGKSRRCLDGLMTDIKECLEGTPAERPLPDHGPLKPSPARPSPVG